MSQTLQQRPQAKIYITPSCPYCVRAVQLLKQQPLNLEIIDLTGQAELRREISAANGGWPTVPMIFVAGTFLGGCSDLEALLPTPKWQTLLSPKP
jgi:glutaredoxin 3